MKMMDASRAIPNTPSRIHLSIQIRLALSKTALYNTTKFPKVLANRSNLGPTQKSISTVCWDLRYHSLLELYLKSSPFGCFKRQEEAAYYLNDLEQMIGEQDVLFYPGSYRRPYQIEDTDNANVLLRAEVLNRINRKKTGGYC
jgi:transcription-repair coupling factor (superfamily II helicase)